MSESCRRCGDLTGRRVTVKTGWRWREWFPGGGWTPLAMGYLEIPVCRACETALTPDIATHVAFCRSLPAPA